MTFVEAILRLQVVDGSAIRRTDWPARQRLLWAKTYEGMRLCMFDGNVGWRYALEPADLTSTWEVVE